jgi:hypothetical protein
MANAIGSSEAFIEVWTSQVFDYFDSKFEMEDAKMRTPITSTTSTTKQTSITTFF